MKLFLRPSTSLPIFVLLSFFAVRLSAQNVRSIADQEVARRQLGIAQAQSALTRGRLAMQAKDFAKAHEEYRLALSYLPDSLVSGKERDEAMRQFCDSGVKLAEQRIAQGKYGEAEKI